MSYFLIIFDRRGSVDPEVIRIEDEDDATTQLFALEDSLGLDGGRGVVMLGADSEDELRRTHGHYFKTDAQLLEARRGVGPSLTFAACSLPWGGCHVWVAPLTVSSARPSARPCASPRSGFQRSVAEVPGVRETGATPHQHWDCA